MKLTITLLAFLSFSVVQAACHEVVDASSEYPDPRPLEVDSLCIDDQDQITLLRENDVVYQFPAVLEIRNVGYRCTHTGRAESSRCGYSKGDLYLVYRDSTVNFIANVHREEGINSGAQYMSFNSRRYKFWVQGRR